jgi:biotin operon repressor
MSKIDILGKLFGSPAKVKIIRLFLFNVDTVHDFEDISKKTKVGREVVRKEVQGLEKIGLVKRKILIKKGKTKKEASKKVQGYVLNKDFYYLSALQNLLIKIPAFTHADLQKKFKGAGAIRLMVVSGVFIQEWDSAADLLIVGDRLNQDSIDRTVSSLEAEIGRELSYVVFSTPEFEYRTNVYDKLVRDILDYPHEKVINTLKI